MSNNSSESVDLLNLPPGTTAIELQQRLREARDASRDQQLEDNIFNNFSEENDDEVALRKKASLLEKQVDRMESYVKNLEEKIQVRRERRQREADITNLTPEERAQYVIDEEERGDEDVPDLDVVFEYMLLIGSSTTNNANDLSQADYINHDNQLRKEAMLDEKVLQQTEYSFINFTSAKNTLETQKETLDDIRHCELSGNSFLEKFTITFDVLEPSLVMCNLNFDVGIQLKMALGPLLQQLKESSNMLGFFQVLVHYARLNDQRNKVFEKLIRKYEKTSIFAESLSDSRLKFQGSREDGMCLILNWKITGENIDRIEANARDNIKFELNMEVIASSEWVAKDQSGVLNKVNESYNNLVKLHGVLKATETIVNKILA